jgi:predicted oxidoreductase
VSAPRLRIDHTDLDVSPVLYGCMKIGGSWTDEPLDREVIDRGLTCIRAALDGGVNFFDHADIYCRGKSEQVFALAWGELGLRREQVVLQSKCGIRRPDEPQGSPHRYDLSREHILWSVAQTLQRLKTDHLDILLLHRPDPLVQPEEVALAFEDLRSQRLVRYFGVSNHNAAQTALLQKALALPLVANQLEINLLHSDLIDEGVTVDSPQRTRLIGDGTIDHCRLHRMSIQAYSPVAKGRITSPPPDADDRTRSVSQAVHETARQRGCSADAVQLAWLLRHPGQIQPVLGSTDPQRIKGSLESMGMELTREEWYRLFTAGRGRALP